MKGKWSAREDETLIELKQKNATCNWGKIAANIDGRHWLSSFSSVNSCLGYTALKKPVANAEIKKKSSRSTHPTVYNVYSGLLDAPALWPGTFYPVEFLIRKSPSELIYQARSG